MVVFEELSAGARHRASYSFYELTSRTWLGLNHEFESNWTGPQNLNVLC